MSKKVSQWMTFRERRNCDTRYADPFPLSALWRDGVLPTVSVFIMTLMMIVVMMVMIMRFVVPVVVVGSGRRRESGGNPECD